MTSRLTNLDWRTERRLLKDRIVRRIIGIGGATVIAAIALIFAYLIWVTLPILLSGSISEAEIVGAAPEDVVYMDLSAAGDVILSVSRAGQLEFLETRTGRRVAGYDLALRISRVIRVDQAAGLYAVLADDAKIRFLAVDYRRSFEGDQRRVEPILSVPFEPISLADNKRGPLDVRLTPDRQLSVVVADGRSATIHSFPNAEAGYALARPNVRRITLPIDILNVYLADRGERLFVIDTAGDLSLWQLDSGVRLDSAYVGTGANAVLAGRASVVTARAEGGVSQWSVANEKNALRLREIRTIDGPDAIITIVPDRRGKGFSALSAPNTWSIYHATSGRLIDSTQTVLDRDSIVAVDAASSRIVGITQDGRLALHRIDNEHPEISLTTLWRTVWYEGYDRPIFSWQSSSPDAAFEPKFSLTPLLLGTFKAAAYALLFAIPVAIMGAIYTAQFMSRRMRALIKPSIEILAALPTVLLGFIGGLWLAPTIEANLSSVLAILLMLPIFLFLLAYLWSLLPKELGERIGGWHWLVAIPVILIAVITAFEVGPILEIRFFGGDSVRWFREEWGWDYEQRNALVVGMMMGLAVIPSIYSIAEDAIFGVPRHLVRGALALGATQWQTLRRVVLLTAGPGIFAAVMIGLGRAVGETMIVLMASGNTPIMDINIFEGMRTFAANIAIELPESEVNSTHFRILFLAALVLFAVTFIFNTVAEIVRQRLRERYGAL